MIRAVSDDAALMAGPNHGSRARGSSPVTVSYTHLTLPTKRIV